MCGKAAEEAQIAERATTRLRLLTSPGWSAAQYPGTCVSCREPFTPGTPIFKDDGPGWIAECCAEQDKAGGFLCAITECPECGAAVLAALGGSPPTGCGEHS